MSLLEKKINYGHICNLIASPYFEVRPGKAKTSFVLHGAIGVSEIDTERVLIKCHGIKLQVCGKKIVLNILEHNTIEVVGRVEEILIINV